MNETEALQWCEDNNAQISYFKVEDKPGNITSRVMVVASGFVASNGLTLTEAVEKCAKQKSISDRKEAVREKRVAGGLIK